MCSRNSPHARILYFSRQLQPTHSLQAVLLAAAQRGRNEQQGRTIASRIRGLCAAVASRRRGLCAAITSRRRGLCAAARLRRGQQTVGTSFAARMLAPPLSGTHRRCMHLGSSAHCSFPSSHSLPLSSLCYSPAMHLLPLQPWLLLFSPVAPVTIAVLPAWADARATSSPLPRHRSSPDQILGCRMQP